MLVEQVSPCPLCSFRSAFVKHPSGLLQTVQHPFGTEKVSLYCPQGLAACLLLLLAVSQAALLTWAPFWLALNVFLLSLSSQLVHEQLSLQRVFRCFPKHRVSAGSRKSWVLPLLLLCLLKEAQRTARHRQKKYWIITALCSFRGFFLQIELQPWTNAFCFRKTLIGVLWPSFYYPMKSLSSKLTAPGEEPLGCLTFSDSLSVAALLYLSAWLWLPAVWKYCFSMIPPWDDELPGLGLSGAALQMSLCSCIKVNLYFSITDGW